MERLKEKSEYHIHKNTETFVLRIFGFPKFVINHNGKPGDTFETIQYNVDSILGEGAYVFFRSIRYEFKDPEITSEIHIPLEHYDTWKRQPPYLAKKQSVS